MISQLTFKEGDKMNMIWEKDDALKQSSKET